MAALELGPEYAGVVAVAIFTFFAYLWMGFQVVKARKRYGVLYPTMYALESENKNAKVFNCVQRGHQNALEVLPFFLMFLLLGSLQHPRAAAVLGVFFPVGRIFYMLGYSTGDPKGRMKGGGVAYIGLFGLAICTMSLAGHLVWPLVKDLLP